VIEREPLDVVVSDIAMPVDDGFALIRQLRGKEGHGARRVPALALTAYAGEHEVDRIVEAGFDACLAKPIEAARLIGAIAGLAGVPS
jgi:CheY-like chemotaxis protein